LATLAVSPVIADNDDFYDQTNLVSDVPKLANRLDSHLVNAWGIDRSGGGPWWVNAAETGLSIIYDQTGLAPFPAVTIPPPLGVAGPSHPTGIVFNSFPNDFKISGNSTVFLFCTEDGTISGWYPGLTTAINMVNNHAFHANYKGLTIGQVSTPSPRTLMYVANFHSGAIEIYDSAFAPTTVPGTFHDPSVPSGFAPFNVLNIGGSIFVAWALPDATHDDEIAGAGLGYVSQFMPDGTFVRSLQHGPWMNAPWGMTISPANFGELSNRILVGQFGSGQIASFDPFTGLFQGLMLSHGNHPVVIEGLWGIKFGNGATAGPANELFFAAGIEDEAHGLFGKLAAKHADKADKEDDNENKEDKKDKHDDH